MPSDRLTGFSSAFDELLERSRRELDALSGGSGSAAPSPSPRESTSSAGGPSAAAARRVAQAVPTRAPTPSPTPRSPAERALDEKLGPGWRYEILDRTRDGDELVVRCRVTAREHSVSRTWHGTASLSWGGRGGMSGMKGSSGNVSFTLGGRSRGGADDPIRAEREAERRAVESALAGCARLLCGYTLSG